MDVEQQDVERFKAMADYIEEIIERDERVLEDLNGRAREWLFWRLRWRRRELRLIRKHLVSLEEALFAVDVFKDLERLDVRNSEDV